MNKAKENSLLSLINNVFSETHESQVFVTEIWLRVIFMVTKLE